MEVDEEEIEGSITKAADAVFAWLVVVVVVVVVVSVTNPSDCEDELIRLTIMDGDVALLSPIPPPTIVAATVA